MEAKKIIFNTMLPLWSMNNGSGGKALFSTVKAYEKNGFQIYMITNQQNDYSVFKNIKKENIFYIDTTWYEKASHKNKFLLPLLTFLHFKYFEKKSYQILQQILKKSCDNVLLYAYEVQAVRQMKKASKKFKIPLITRFQGTIMSQFKNNLFYKIRKYPHLQALSTPADLIIMTDDGTQGDQVLRKCKNTSKCMFIRNGVNILDSKLEDSIDKEKLKQEMKLSENKTILLTVSRLVSWKRVDRAISAIQYLKDKENYMLIIVGEGEERAKLEELTHQLELDRFVYFTGAVKNEEVRKYMQVADIFLSFYDLSNVGNPLLEALCLGKPIITYNVGDTNKIIDNQNGILLDDVSPENIAKNINILNHQENLKKYSKKALEYAHNNLYSWKKRMEIEVEEVKKLYK